MTGYLLSKKEGRVGGPERPLSGLGEVTYKRYWKLSVMRYLYNAPKHPSIEGMYSVGSFTLGRADSQIFRMRQA